MSMPLLITLAYPAVSLLVALLLCAIGRRLKGGGRR